MWCRLTRPVPDPSGLRRRLTLGRFADDRLKSAAAGGLRACRASFLDRRTRSIAKRAVDAAVAGIGTKDRPTALAVIEELAGIGGHRVSGLMTTGRAGQGGGDLHYDTHFINIGSIEPQIAAKPTSTVATTRRPTGRRDRGSSAQASPGAQGLSCLRHHMAHATATAKPLRTRSGVRMLANSAKTLARPAPTPIEASASGNTQQAAAAVTAPKPRAAASEAMPRAG